MILNTPIDNMIDDLTQIRNEHLRFQCLIARATEFQFAGPNGRFIARNNDVRSTLVKTWCVIKYEDNKGYTVVHAVIEEYITMENACRLAADKAGLTEGIMSPWYPG